MDERRELIKKVYDFLKKNEFKVSEPDLYGLVTFDLICKSHEKKYIIKVLYNIDTFSKISVTPLIKMGVLTDSIAIIIGEKAGNGKLENYVLYFRHGVPIMSLETFIEYIKGQDPYIYSAPGGFYVQIDGKKMREIREKKKYSIGYISQKLGVSRRSVSLYESGSSATIDIYFKLEKILNCDVSKNLNINITRDNINIKQEYSENDFIKEVFNIMNNFGYVSEYISRNPFDGLSYDLKSFLIVGAFTDINSNANRIISIKKISEILDDTPVIINRENTEKENLYGCPVINIKELKNMYDGDKFKRMLEKRL